jgi:hypothetical protein
MEKDDDNLQTDQLADLEGALSLRTDGVRRYAPPVSFVVGADLQTTAPTPEMMMMCTRSCGRAAGHDLTHSCIHRPKLPNSSLFFGLGLWII